jgi:type III secretion regulatory protein HpaA
MSIPRIGGSYLPLLQPAAPETPRPAGPVTQTDQQAPPELQPLSPHLRRHRPGQTLSRRVAGRKKRDADNPHGDLNAESEDLLMMLEQHLLRDDRQVAKTGERGAGDQQSSSHGRDPGGGFDSQHAPAGGPAHDSVPWTMRLVTRPPRDEADLLTQWRAAARIKAGTGMPRARAEQALMALPAVSRRAAAPGTREPASPTYPILAIMREFLSLPEANRTRPATLADVRDRLLAAAAGPAGAGRGDPRRPLPAAEESLNLLLPIVLLNLGRQRTRAGRAIGISSLAALIRRGRGW